MKLKYNLYFTQFGDHWCGVGMGEDARTFSGVLTLNEMGYDIVKHLHEEISYEELIDRVLSEYDATREEATEAVDKVITKLREENILAE